VKQARNLSANFNRISISRNTTHRQSLNPQAIVSGDSWMAKTRAEKANNFKSKANTS